MKTENAIFNSSKQDISEYNKNDNNELPAPAVFVIDTNGEITYKFVDTNYTNRINIQELVEQL